MLQPPQQRGCGFRRRRLLEGISSRLRKRRGCRFYRLLHQDGNSSRAAVVAVSVGVVVVAVVVLVVGMVRFCHLAEEDPREDCWLFLGLKRRRIAQCSIYGLVRRICPGKYKYCS